MPKLDLPAGPVERFAYSIEEVTKVTGLGRSYIYEEIRDGRLRIRKAGRRSLVLPDDLQAWLASLPGKPS
jgi:excisionase family DNA binding protein